MRTASKKLARASIYAKKGARQSRWTPIDAPPVDTAAEIQAEQQRRAAALKAAKRQNARQRAGAKPGVLTCAAIPCVMRTVETKRLDGDVPVPVAIQSWLARRKRGSKV